MTRSAAQIPGPGQAPASGAGLSDTDGAEMEADRSLPVRARPHVIAGPLRDLAVTGADGLMEAREHRGTGPRPAN
ncbi:hypothetical protein AQJ30_03590 [Streptomyces longwoodensis]|uniref:Uncharacterized protein n=1 Tax=Streptomyces longwoodensis TaxID=68231 RepID=A0A101R3F2_9ACTN|nr:hypothetical protein [Streptomyces longwoodensis]KUN40985.1 hypothetical protein AQJ30_03590 [Streptomyces longwoodensis]